MSGSEMRFEFDEEQLKTIQKVLGNKKGKAKNVLKNAINYTAVDAQRQLAKKAQETYDVQTTKFTKAMKRQNATQSRLQSTIKVTDRQLELKSFKVVPRNYNPKRRPAVTKARVLFQNTPKALDKNGIKSFIVKFKNGHVTVAQRERQPRFPIRTLMSNSIPVMIGNEKRVYGIVEPEIYSNLQKHINKEIERIFQ